MHPVSSATGPKPGFFEQIRSFPPTFYIANTMEIFERMAWYGFYAVSSLYITGPKETGALGFTSEQRGQLQAIVPFLLYLFPVVTGALADRYGYKRMFLIAYTGMVIAYYMLGQFETFWSFLGAFMMVAVSAAIFKPVVVGTIARVTNEHNSATGFGIFYMMVNVGGFIGPLVAGAIRGISWDYVFIACSTWAFINLIIVSLFYKEPTTESGSTQRRTIGKVARDMVEVLGNLRFGITVFVVLIALMVANQRDEKYAWPICGAFIAAWLLLNLVWDFLMPPGSGNPAHPESIGRPFFMKRMHCSNWRFALYLLLLSGFWTSFNQIFITTPEYIRDYTETKPMVDLIGRRLFTYIGKPEWIDALAAVEEPEIMREFDQLIRRARGLPPMLETSASKPAATDDELVAIAMQTTRDPALPKPVLVQLDENLQEVNSRSAPEPLQISDIAQASRTLLQYKVRIPPVEVVDLLSKLPAGPIQPGEKDLLAAVAAVNRRLDMRGQPPFADGEAAALSTELSSLMTKHGVAVPAAELTELKRKLRSDKRPKLEEADLATGVQSLAIRPTVWERVDAGRQVNAEHIVNFDALAIVLLQVLVSFTMSRFHRFTTMIVGMVIAAIGIGMAAFGGGMMIGAVGASLAVVVIGIVVFAIGEMMASPTSQDVVGRIAPPDKVALYMGYYFVSVALGNLFGGILSGQLYGKLARDMQRPDLMWLAFGGIMFATAVSFVLYNRFAIPREARAGASV